MKPSTERSSTGSAKSATGAAAQSTIAENCLSVIMYISSATLLHTQLHARGNYKSRQLAKPKNTAVLEPDGKGTQ
jgi:hypothetical protein